LSPQLSTAFPQCLFPAGYRLLPGLREVYELHLAWLEAEALGDSQLVSQAAYFWSIDGCPTRHFLTCAGETLKLPEHSSSRLKSFFAANNFRTGYATHGLFPYRGKFHPQMVRGILNAMGMRPGNTVLDPMMGSGTVLIEASLLGIQSVGIDISPFCVFMTQAKASGLSMSLRRAEGALRNIDSTFDYFARQYGVSCPDPADHLRRGEETWRIIDEGKKYVVSGRNFRDQDTAETYALLFLAFLDAMGYAQRTQCQAPKRLFQGVLERYLHCCQKFQSVKQAHQFDLGPSVATLGDARSMDVPADSVDGILFSPPYSFAIDYVENDAYHLTALDVDRHALKDRMIGLRGGRKLVDKYACYLEDIKAVLRECHRVLRTGAYCVMVVGTNSNQLSQVLKVPADQVPGLHRVLRSEAEAVGFSFSNEIARSIKGMANTMRDEFIVFLRKA
jgi:ubiquinone/menaquinone biosynthesis C-methylase UbiE